jgi:hypothetical protein
MTGAERTLRARLAAHSLHAQRDSRGLTKNARVAFLDRFEREVDPERELDPAERTRRAEHAKRAHFQRMALKSAQARRRRAGTGGAVA